MGFFSFDALCIVTESRHQINVLELKVEYLSPNYRRVEDGNTLVKFKYLKIVQNSAKLE